MTTCIIIYLLIAIDPANGGGEVYDEVMHKARSRAEEIVHAVQRVISMY